MNIDPEFKNLIPPMTAEEYSQLKQNILTEGCRDPLIIWKDHNILLDGHNRYEICNELNSSFRTEELTFPDRQTAYNWIINNQLGRRNLHPNTSSYLRGKRYNLEKKDQGGDHKSKDQNDLLINTAQKIANDLNVSEPTIKRDGDYAETLDIIEPETKTEILQGKSDITKKELQNISREVKKAEQEVRETYKETNAAIEDARKEAEKQQAESEIEEARQQAEIEEARQQAEIEKAKRLKAEEALEKIRQEKTEKARLKLEKKTNIIKNLESIETQQAKKIEGVYDVIVIDPPWPMKKIERDCRPNQVEFDYPTMTIEEIADMKIPVAENCHVWLWTTHKFMPDAFDIFKRWSVKYVCCFTWHKPGGFQPVGLPQYNSEFILYGRIGTPVFTETKSFPTCFDAQRGKHSEKPQEFYDILSRVTAGRRLDMFNRREIPGFETWGKEAV